MIKFINGYNTRNLNKTAWMLSLGASFSHVTLDENNYVTFYLNGVNENWPKMYWREDLQIQFWKFWKLRAYLKEQYQLALTAKNEQKL